MQDVFYEEQDQGDSAGRFRRTLSLALKWGAAAISLGLVAAIILWSYQLGVRDAREIPVIKALEKPARIRPADPGGTTVAHQGLEVNEILAGNAASAPGEATLAPEPLGTVESDAPASADGGDAAADAGEVTLEDLLKQALEDRIERGIAAVAARPRARPTPDTDDVALLGNQAPEGEIAPGTRLVQLGAYDSESAAIDQWDRLLQAHGDLLGTKRRYIQEAESNGRTFFRLRVTGFGTGLDQSVLCEALRARQVPCIPVTVR